MKTNICKIIAVVLALSFPFESPAGYALSSASRHLALQRIGVMMEISWVMGNIRYSGLMVIKKDDMSGVFVVKYMLPGIGIVRVRQDAQLRNEYNAFGCTSIIECSNPISNPEGIGYSSDSFLVNPNGSMATMDANGNWSMMIAATQIMPNFWMDKLTQYGLNADLSDMKDDNDNLRRGTPKYAMSGMWSWPRT